MFRTCMHTLVIVAAGLLTAGTLRAEDNITTEDPAGETPVWVGVQVYYPYQQKPEYLIGTISKKTLDAIELNKFDKRFLRISNLRIEVEDAEDEDGGATHYDCSDAFDWGIILVQYRNVLSIELKKRDPLTVQRSMAVN